MATRVLLADDHLMFREGLRSLLERDGVEVVGEAKDGLEAVRLSVRHRPDVAVLDLGMPLFGGMDAAREILRRLPDMRVILLTMYDEDRYREEAIRVGVSGYILKTRASRDLLAALRAVTSGAIHFVRDGTGAVG